MSYSRCSVADNDISYRPMSSLFTLELPYKPPSARLGQVLWRWRIWVEITLGASVLTPGEKVAFMIFWALVLFLLVYAAVVIIPAALFAAYPRTLFYIFGEVGPQRLQALHKPVVGWVHAASQGVVANVRNTTSMGAGL
ncbi:hypothetical protein PENSPDRAFT_660840 [Peniophora sp. CONT]|nr:hypothetical protein PENSPDRAFT_660840 [Peniophora sp. CONT]